MLTPKAVTEITPIVVEHIERRSRRPEPSDRERFSRSAMRASLLSRRGPRGTLMRMSTVEGTTP